MVYIGERLKEARTRRLLIQEELAQKREQAELTETTRAWLLTLRQHVAEIEEDKQEAFRTRRQLVKLLVAGLTVGK